MFRFVLYTDSSETVSEMLGLILLTKRVHISDHGPAAPNVRAWG